MADKMISILNRSLLFFWVFVTTLASAKSASTSGYVGYDLKLEGDDDSVVFSTDDTRPNAAQNLPDPDVYLNASGKITDKTCQNIREIDHRAVHVSTIDLQVDNLVCFFENTVIWRLLTQLDRQNQSRRPGPQPPDFQRRSRS